MRELSKLRTINGALANPSKHISRALLAVSVSCGVLLAQPTLRITEPSDGTLVASGQTVGVVVQVSPPGAFQMVVVVAGDPIGYSDSRATAPYQFHLQVPAKAEPGRYPITASGIIGPGNPIHSAPIHIQVEHPGTPLSLRAEPSILEFDRLGDECPIDALGRFADADRVDLERSTYIRFVSDASQVATVTPSGWVTAVGPGTAQITIRYQGVSVVVPVTVKTQ
jgi:hypothetical protein